MQSHDFDYFFLQAAPFALHEGELHIILSIIYLIIHLPEI